jgi:hypothetical protein
VPFNQLQFDAQSSRRTQPRITVILSGVSRVFFARSAGTQDRAPRSTVSRAWEMSRRTSLGCNRAASEGTRSLIHCSGQSSRLAKC